MDNLSSGFIENVHTPLEKGAIDFIEADLLDPKVADAAVQNIDIDCLNRNDE